MKKILMSASALAFVFGAAGTANAAAEWSPISLSGSFDMYALYGENDLVNDDNEGFDFTYGAGGSVGISSSIVTDSGLTYGASYDSADEVGTGYVSGSFGKITVGEIGGAAGSYAAGFSNAGVLGNAMDEDFYPLVPGTGSTGIATPSGTGAADDAVGIQYDLPSFSGFSAGVSYQRCIDGPACEGDDGVGNATYGDKSLADDSDIFQVGAGYGTSFGGADVNVGIGYSTLDEDLHLSSNATMGGFRVGGSIGIKDGTNGYDVGVGYSTGPWDTSIGYAWDEDGDNSGIAVNVAYDVAPGVTAVAFGGKTEDAANEASVFGTGLRFSF